MQLRGKTHTTHHTQGVIAKGNIWVKRRGDEAVFHIKKPIEAVDEFPKPIGIEAYGQGIDGKVTTREVILQCSVFHDRLTTITRITFTAGTDKFNSASPIFTRRRGIRKLGRSEILEYRQMGLTTKFLFQGLCEGNTRRLAKGKGQRAKVMTPNLVFCFFQLVFCRSFGTNHHTIYVLGWTFEEKVAHISPNEVALEAYLVGSLPYLVKDGSCKQFLHLFATNLSHSPYSLIPIL